MPNCISNLSLLVLIVPTNLWCWLKIKSYFLCSGNSQSRQERENFIMSSLPFIILAVFLTSGVVLKKRCGNVVPHQITRKTALNSSNEVSIRLQEFPHWIFLFHSRRLTSSANVRVASTSEIAAMFVVGTPFPPHYSPVLNLVNCKMHRIS